MVSAFRSGCAAAWSRKTAPTVRRLTGSMFKETPPPAAVPMNRAPGARCRRSAAPTPTCRPGRLGRLPLEVLGVHGLDQALRPHVGPVLLDVFEALVAAGLAENARPPGGDLGEGRPERMLPLVVHEHEEPAF